jgi:hypothetical protein
MKKTLKIISTLALILFGVLWVSSKLNFMNEFNSIDIRNILVLIYLFTCLKYFQIEVKDKNAEIQELKLKLVKQNKSQIK